MIVLKWTLEPLPDGKHVRSKSPDDAFVLCDDIPSAGVLFIYARRSENAKTAVGC